MGGRHRDAGADTLITLPLHPKNPERICWGCTKYCGADVLACGNRTIRTLHPAELFGEDWFEWVQSRGGQETEDPTTVLASTRWAS